MPRDTLFRRSLQQRHLTVYEAFVAQFHRAAKELAERDGDPRLGSLTVSSRQFDRWVGGELQGTPHPDPCRVLEYMLGASAAELFSEPEVDRTRPLVPVAVAQPVHSAAPESGESPLGIVARTRQLTSSNVDEGTIAFLGSSLDRVVGRYEQDGPRLLRAQTRSLRQLVHTLLDGHQPPRVRQQLFRLAARAAGLLGYMAVNTGEFVLAEAYCTESAELSRAIDDIETEMWAMGTLFFGFYYAGRYAEADACAAAAVELAPQNAQAIRLLVNGRARALGKIGEREGTRRAIDQALELSDLHDVQAGITPCISFEPYGYARSLANAVTAYLALHDVGQVLNNAEQIDHLVENSDSPWSRSLVRLDVATALVQQRSPDVDRAMALGKEALGFCGESPIRSVWQRSRDLYEEAQRWPDHPAVGEYGDELRAWSSQPAALAMSHPRAR